MSTPVEELLSEKGVPFNFSGHDLLIRCLNPEHPDKNPSLRVDKLTGMLHCFSCGFKGNIFTHFGVVQNLQSSEVRRIKEKIQGIFAESVGLEMPFGYTYYDKPFRGISVETLRRFEAFTHKDFENRIVFPIRDPLGKIRVFLGRHLFSNDKSVKRYDIKPSGVPVPFFPHNPTVEGGTIVFVEGIFDALNLINGGMENVVSTMGTQGLTEKNAASKLSNYRLMGCTRVVLLYDADEAGIKQKETIMPVIQKLGLLCESVDLDGESYKDPGDLPPDEVKRLKKVIKNANSSSG